MSFIRLRWVSINFCLKKKTEGKNFFKSKFIARETGMLSKEVGTNMGILAETSTRFSIQKYSYSNRSTWLITASQVSLTPGDT